MNSTFVVFGFARVLNVFSLIFFFGMYVNVCVLGDFLLMYCLFFVVSVVLECLIVCVMIMFVVVSCLMMLMIV